MPDRLSAGVSDSLVVRRYREGDRAAVMRLLEEVYPGISSPAAFSWRFDQNPTGEPILVVAEDDSGIVGLNSWMRWPMASEGRDLVAWQSGESAVHARARGRGVFGRLLREGARLGVAEGGDLFFGFPNQASIGSFLRTDWKLVHTLRWWVRPTPFALLGLKGHSPSAAPAAVPDTRFQFRRSEEFVRWRIESNPYHRYETHHALNGTRVISRARPRGPISERMVIAGLTASGGLLNPRHSAALLGNTGARSAFVSFAATDRLGGGRMTMPMFHRVRGKGVYFIVLCLNPLLEESAIYSPGSWEPTPFEVDIL